MRRNVKSTQLSLSFSPCPTSPPTFSATSSSVSRRTPSSASAPSADSGATLPLTLHQIPLPQPPLQLPHSPPQRLHILPPLLLISPLSAPSPSPHRRPHPHQDARPHRSPSPPRPPHHLILISHYNFMKSWVIWNPFTRQFHRLPEPDFNIDIPFAGVGIGYDFAADDYKVAKIYDWYRDGKIVYTTLIYSLKNRSWKPIKDFPCDSMLLRSSSVYHDGALHWLAENVIMALDLGSEEYRLVALPPLGTRLGEPLDMYLDNMDGCFLLRCYYTSEGLLMDSFEMLEGWVMEDGVWIKVFSFGGEGDHAAAVMRELRPVAYLKSIGQVFLQHRRHF